MTKTSRALGVGLLLAGLTTALGQSAKDVQTTLEATLKGRQMPIRDFLADHRIDYSWVGGSPQHEPEGVFTLGMLQIDSVKVRGGAQAEAVTIKGKRRTLLLRDPAAVGALSAVTTAVTIEVDLHGADAAAVQHLPDTLFFASAEEALAVVPGPMVLELPMNRMPGKRKTTWMMVDGIWQEVPKDASMQPPRVLSAPPPEFSDEARMEKVNGDVLIGLTAGPDGSVKTIWILRPLGFGLDESACRAVAAYRFDPPRYHAEKVGFAMAVAVNYQIH